MKKLRAISLLIWIIFLGFSCSNDFDLTAEWEDIPIVYGLLSRQDTAQYIKIQKAFLDPDANALDIAQIPDSLYYENLDVQIEHLKSGKIYTLSRVDGNLEGYPKEEGVFADAPNYLYKFKLRDDEELVEGETYQLTINRGDDKPEVIADDVIVSDVTITSPFAGTPLKILYRDFTIQWRSEDDARLFDLRLAFNYRENSLHPDSLNIYTDKTIVWTVATNIDRKEGSSLQTKYDLPGEGFYQFLGAELVANPELKRQFRSIEFVVDAGGEEIFQYINIGQANTGITSSQVIPTYTNLSEGFGVFSSVNKGISLPFGSLHPQMRDSLEFGIYTADLNFQL
jgi:Domain of unknown function (DUF4249)